MQDPQAISEGSTRHRWILPFLLALIIISAGDLWSKAAVFEDSITEIHDGRPIAFSTIEHPWWVKPAWNTGVAWSMFEDSPLFIAFLTAFLVPILVFSYFRWYRNHHIFVDLAFGMVIGGALANAYDRFMTHFSDAMFGVRDFLAFTIPIIEYRWPTFNIADAGISVGFVMLLIASFVQEHRVKQLENKETDPKSGSSSENPKVDA